MIWDYRYILVLLKIVTELLFFVFFAFGVLLREGEEMSAHYHLNPQVSALVFNITVIIFLVSCIL